jgi:hypothetical protein
MLRSTLKFLAVLAAMASVLAAQTFAQDGPGIAERLPERVLFVTSGGYWQVTAPTKTGETADTTAQNDAGLAAQAAPARGYYRLIAVRGEDNRSLVDLQRIALAPEGPRLMTSTPVEAINDLGAYVTDIRPENSTGASSGPGFAAFIYLKTDPTVVEPETWSVFVDEFGDIAVEKSSN